MILRTGDASPEGANIALAALRIPEPRFPSTAQNFLDFTFCGNWGGGEWRPSPLNPTKKYNRRFKHRRFLIQQHEKENP